MTVEPLKEPFYFLSVPVVVNRTIYIQLSFKEISPQIILNFNSRNHLNFKHSYVKMEVFTGLFAAFGASTAVEQWGACVNADPLPWWSGWLEPPLFWGEVVLGCLEPCNPDLGSH